jgi:hypothetical protein
MSNLYIQHQLGEGLFRQTQSRAVVWDASREFDQQPLRRLSDQENGEAVVSTGENVRQQEPLHGEPTAHSWLSVIYASVVWAGTTYIVRIHRICTAERMIDGRGSHLSFLPPCSFSMRRLHTSPPQLRPPSFYTAFTHFRDDPSLCWSHRASLF